MGQGTNCCGVSTNKHSAPREGHCRGRQSTAKNPILEIKISAHKANAYFNWRLYLLRHFHFLPPLPPYPPDASVFVERLAAEEGQERSFLEKPAANTHKCAETQEPGAFAILLEVMPVNKGRSIPLWDGLGLIHHSSGLHAACAEPALWWLPDTSESFARSPFGKYG